MNPDKTIIQADGVPMSGTETLECTLQAIAHAQIYQDLDLPIFISGGTNAFTKEFAEKFNIRYDGITIGSYARAIVKDAITCADTKLAIEIAKKLVKNVKD